MELTGAEIFVRCLAEQGIDYVFGYPGGAILPIYDELHKAESRGWLKHILVRHEQGGTHAADAYARATGQVGVEGQGQVGEPAPAHDGRILVHDVVEQLLYFFNLFEFFIIPEAKFRRKPKIQGFGQMAAHEPGGGGPSCGEAENA